MKLGKIYSPIKGQLLSVDDVIEKELESDNALISRINNYLLEGRGKKMRAALVLFSAGSSCGKGKSNPGGGTAIALAAAIEFIHAATLIHDDVIDGANLRRKKPSISSKWGNEISVVFGDYILSKAFRILAHIDNNEISKRLSSVTDNLCQGELAQINSRLNMNLSEPEYLDIIGKKTASLMSACCELGAVVSGNSKFKKYFSAFGNNLGMAFQIKDDCLDIIGDELNTGKPLGKDISEGELTMPLIYTLKKATKLEKKKIAGFMNSKNGYYFNAIKDIAFKYDAIGYSNSKAIHYLSHAKASLLPLEQSPCKESLLALCDYVIERRS